MSHCPARLVSVACSLLLVTSCAYGGSQIRSNALHYLYPKGTQGVPASDVQLKVPVRVGVAFPPGARDWEDRFSESQKVALLTRLAAAFNGREGIGSVQVIPSNYLSPSGGFEDLERISPAFGVDLMVLVSYDQFQITETSRWNLTYLTIVGAYIVEGEENETRTLMDAVVFDIASRAMLFHALGQSSVKTDATPIDVAKVLRKNREAGFELAMSDLITNLDTAVAVFQKQVKSGTVRGPGTPKIETAALGGSGTGTQGGGFKAGALAFPELASALLLLGLAFFVRRDRKAGSAARRSS